MQYTCCTISKTIEQKLGAKVQFFEVVKQMYKTLSALLELRGLIGNGTYKMVTTMHPSSSFYISTLSDLPKVPTPESLGPTPTPLVNEISCASLTTHVEHNAKPHESIPSEMQIQKFLHLKNEVVVWPQYHSASSCPIQGHPVVYLIV
jgi:hypothetical protein